MVEVEEKGKMEKPFKGRGRRVLNDEAVAIVRISER